MNNVDEAALVLYLLMNKLNENDMVNYTFNEFDKFNRKPFAERLTKAITYQALRTALTQYVGTLEKKPLIILVDELDRVRPNYSVKFLEAIKHIFSINGICFVLAVDRGQLESSIKQLYGDYDFDNYYRRFITREISLTIAKDISLNDYVQQLAQEFFDEKINNGIKFCIDPKSRSNLLGYISSVARAFSLTARQIQQLFRTLVHFIAIEKSDKFARYSWLEATILLIALSIKSPALYHKLGLGKMSAEELYNYINSLTYPQYNSQLGYFLNTALAFNLRNDDKTNDFETAELLAVFKNMKIEDKEKEAVYRDTIGNLTKIIDDWGQLQTISSFSYLYNRLEEWNPFLD